MGADQRLADVEANFEAEEQSQQGQDDTTKMGGCCSCCPGRCSGRRCVVFACGIALVVIVIVLVVIYFVIKGIVFRQAEEGFFQLSPGVKEFIGSGLVMANMTFNLWWPGCFQVSNMTDFASECGLPCFPAQRMIDMQAFNEENAGMLVTYPSRVGAEANNLTGWWLPAPADSAIAPRIVLQHGFQENSNHFRQMKAAYMLRSLGFSVLVNNFRDHGYSADSPQQIAMWGDDRYVHDLLGAWDYARNDPDGVLGGSIPASKVGLMGLSLGGFTTANAFGLEGEVPAVWIDASPFQPESAFRFGAQQALDGMGIGFLAPLMLGAVWSDLLEQASQKGIEWNQNLPEKNLPLGPDSRRPTYLVANTDDTTIPNAGAESDFAQLLAVFEEYPGKYDVVGTFVTEGSCNGLDHCTDHLRDFDEYLSRMCNFWRPAFGFNASTCP